MKPSAIRKLVMKIIRMAPQDFERAVAAASSRRSFKTETVNMARSVLVEGEKVTDVATRYGKHHQQLTLTLDKIRKAHGEISSSAITRIELDLPGELANELVSLSEAISKHGNIEEVNAITRRLLVDVRSAVRKLK